MRFKVGDKVRIRSDLKAGHQYGKVVLLANGEMEQWLGRTGIVTEIIGGCYKIDNEYFWSVTMLEPTSLIPTFDDIRSDSLDCVIHTETIEEAKKLGDCLCSSMYQNSEVYWDIYSRNTAFSIRNGVISGYACVDFYLENKADYGEIYEFKDIEAHSAIQSCIDNAQFKNEEDKPMRLTFSTTEGYRIDTSNNTKIPTITTKVDCIFGDLIQSGSATCDKFNYDERQGVIEAVANALFRGKFDREYNRAVKANYYCGKVFDTVEERQAHEVWHVERRKARHERYLLRKRAKEIAFEEQAQKMAKEMLEEQK